MNAWATWVAGQWLMGECEINDLVDESSGEIIGKNQGLLVKRCRFLEESGCASICVNSCKIPTQNFFLDDMGLPLTMTPNYDTHECQFAFGVTPTQQNELDAMNTPCLSRCPTVGSLRKLHYNNNNGRNNTTTSTKIDGSTGTTGTLRMNGIVAANSTISTDIEYDGTILLEDTVSGDGNQCAFMENSLL